MEIEHLPRTENVHSDSGIAVAALMRAFLKSSPMARENYLASLQEVFGAVIRPEDRKALDAILPAALGEFETSKAHVVA